MNKQLIKSIFNDDPEIQALLAAQDKRELEKRLEKILPLKDGEEGEKGDKGDPGEKGDKGERGEKGEQGISGRDGKDGRNGKDGRDGRDGTDGKDFDIKVLDKYLESFEKFELRLESVEKSNTVNPKGKIDQRWHGAGLSKVSTDSTLTGNGTPSSPLSVVSSGSSFTPLTTPSVINDTNTAFTFTKLPSVLIINGGMYQQTGGSITWTWTAGILTATLSSPVGVGGSIFGLS